MVTTFRDRARVRGYGEALLLRADGRHERIPFVNLITQVGDQVYMERGANIGGPPSAPTGMRLGTGSTAVAKTGAGAAIVTYLTGSNAAFSGTPGSAVVSGARQITYAAAWAAGVATTATDITECVITNENPLTNVAGTAANTVSRALFAAGFAKDAGDSLTVTWIHEFEGA